MLTRTVFVSAALIAALCSAVNLQTVEPATTVYHPD